MGNEERGQLWRLSEQLSEKQAQLLVEVSLLFMQLPQDLCQIECSSFGLV